MNIDEEEWGFAMVMSENFEKKLRQENAKLKERIEELENANMKISTECHKLVDSLEQKQNRIKELEEANKTNEWHYVKDEKPKDNEYVLIYTDLKNTYVARIPTEKDYFITRRGGYIQMSAVIAWKEIVPPSEPMRSFDKEEQKNYTEAINKVYKPTGVKLFNKESE